MLMLRSTHDREIERLEKSLARLRLRRRALEKENARLRKRLKRELHKQPVGALQDLAQSDLPAEILQAIAQAPASDERTRRHLITYAELQLLAKRKPQAIAEDIIAGEAGPETDDFEE